VPQACPDEGRQVAGIATGDEAVVFDDFLVKKFSPGIVDNFDDGPLAG
jgi:hypothetical protein